MDIVIDCMIAEGHESARACVRSLRRQDDAQRRQGWLKMDRI